MLIKENYYFAFPYKIRSQNAQITKLGFDQRISKSRIESVKDAVSTTLQVGYSATASKQNNSYTRIGTKKGCVVGLK